MNTFWRCDADGAVPPMHVVAHVGEEVLAHVATNVAHAATAPKAAHVAADVPAAPLPMWCPWPLPPGWTVTGASWVGDDRSGPVAAAIACTGPAPLESGTADVVLVAEEPGVGLGNRLAGLPGTDPGPYLIEPLQTAGAHAKVKIAGHPTALWSVQSPDDRSAYVGEARGRWLIAVAWPASAGYMFTDRVAFHDLTEWLPPELVYGAPSPYLLGAA